MTILSFFLTSLLLRITFYLVIAYSSHHAVVFLDKRLACASHPTPIASHHFTSLLHTIKFSPVIWRAVVLTYYLLHCFHNPRSCIISSVSSFAVPVPSNMSETCTACWAISSGNFCCFSFTSSLSICTVSCRACFLNCRLLLVGTYQEVIRSSCVLAAYIHLRLLVSSVLYRFILLETELSPLCMHCLLLIKVHSGPFLYSLSFNVFLSIFFRSFSISHPFLLFVASPSWPIFSCGLLASPTLEQFIGGGYIYEFEISDERRVNFPDKNVANH